MGQIQVPKKLKVEDFPSDQQSLISKLGYIYNNFTEEIYFLLQKGLDFNNLNQDIVSVTIQIDSSGKLINPPQILHNLQTKPQGVICISAQNVTNPAVYPTSAPFISWTITDRTHIKLLNISGLQINSKYALTLEIIGTDLST